MSHTFIVWINMYSKKNQGQVLWKLYRTFFSNCLRTVTTVTEYLVETNLKICGSNRHILEWGFVEQIWTKCCQCTMSLKSSARGKGLNKHESPSPKHAVELGLWFWRRRFLNVVNTFSLFRCIFPLEKGVVLHLNKPSSLE